jgi:hypothetical protein
MFVCPDCEVKGQAGEQIREESAALAVQREASG